MLGSCVWQEVDGDFGSFSLAVLGSCASLEPRGPARWPCSTLRGWEIKRTELGLSESQGHVCQLDLCLSEMQIPGPYPRTAESYSL